MSADFVVHPDGTVDYPDTGCYTMSAEEFAAADTRQAWSQAKPPPESQPYYEPHRYEPTYHEPPHHDWMRVLKLVSGITAGALVIAAVIVLVTSLTKPVTPMNPSGYATATQTVTASAPPTTATQTVTALPAPTQTVTALPVPMDPEEQLRQIANGDRPFVSVRLADRWVPQLSSKRPGVVDQGIVWDNATTLQEHSAAAGALPRATAVVGRVVHVLRSQLLGHRRGHHFPHFCGRAGVVHEPGI